MHLVMNHPHLCRSPVLMPAKVIAVGIEAAVRVVQHRIPKVPTNQSHIQAKTHIRRRPVSHLSSHRRQYSGNKAGQVRIQTAERLVRRLEANFAQRGKLGMAQCKLILISTRMLSALPLFHRKARC